MRAGCDGMRVDCDKLNGCDGIRVDCDKLSGSAAMNLESIRAFCTALPHVTEDVKWGHDLCFLIGGKMFAVTSLDAVVDPGLAFKCTPENFAELIEVDGIIPAPYMARNNWVKIERDGALRGAELRDPLRESYAMVVAKF